MGVFGARVYEKSRYEVLAGIDHRFEIRRYAPRLAAQIELPQANRRGRDEAFRALFAYIAGANSASGSASARIAMTVPVAVEQPTRIPMTVPVLTSERGGGIRMQFFLPAKYTFVTAPKPRDKRMTLVPIQSATVAILRFSGSDSDCFEKQIELIAKLEGSQWKPIEPPYALFYDAPSRCRSFAETKQRSLWRGFLKQSSSKCSLNVKSSKNRNKVNVLQHARLVFAI